jgi:hypothetical protein
MKSLIFSIFIVFSALITEKIETSVVDQLTNQITLSSRINHNKEYEKYYADLDKNIHKIPTLESLFQVTKYWDNNNRSSPCTHVGKKRSTLCHKVVEFDKEGYEKSLQDTRKLILSRLNLEHEPHVKLNENTFSFINQIENEILNEEEEGGQSKESTIKTSLDKKVTENKEFNSMHEAFGNHLYI